MASKIFKPRRGKKSTMAGTKATTVLSAGEMFVEVPDTGAGTGHSKMKIGDGTTAYSSLPYAMGDTAEDEIAFSSNTSTTVATALNAVASGGKLKNLIAGLKQAISLCNTSVTTLNDNMESMKTSFQDGVDTLYNKCVSCGATPSTKTPTDVASAIDTVYNLGKNYGILTRVAWNHTQSNASTSINASYTATKNGQIIVVAFACLDGNYSSNSIVCTKNSTTLSPTYAWNATNYSQPKYHEFIITAVKDDIISCATKTTVGTSTIEAARSFAAISIYA